MRTRAAVFQAVSIAGIALLLLAGPIAPAQAKHRFLLHSHGQHNSHRQAHCSYGPEGLNPACAPGRPYLFF